MPLRSRYENGEQSASNIRRFRCIVAVCAVIEAAHKKKSKKYSVSSARNIALGTPILIEEEFQSVAEGWSDLAEKKGE